MGCTTCGKSNSLKQQPRETSSVVITPPSHKPLARRGVIKNPPVPNPEEKKGS